jgi:hypothetical protein
LARVVTIVALALALTSPAAGRDVTVQIVTGAQPGAARERGGLGLYVPGQGLYVSREEALERLGRLPEGVCSAIERCPYELIVSVPPLGAQSNERRYEVTILGRGYDGILVSDSTRIPGLVSITDVRETVAALEQGRDPPIETEASDDPLGELARLDDRLGDARSAQVPANVALALVLLVLTAAALARRSALLARTALLYAPAAILLALAASALELVGPIVTTVLMVAAAPVALAVAAFVRLTLAVPVFLGLFGLVLAVSPETNSLMAIGPHPWSGGRFYGVTNQVETLLLGPVLAAAASLAGWRLAALGLLALVVVGASETGADGGGILVFATGFIALWLFLRGRPRSLPWALVGVVALGLAFVGIDALAGGSSHVVDAVADGPDDLLDTLRARLERSVSIATSTVWQLAVLVGGVGVLAYFAALRPRFAAVDALLVALAVSLLVNDSPTKVAGFGAIVCGALRAWSVCEADREGRQSVP